MNEIKMVRQSNPGQPTIFALPYTTMIHPLQNEPTDYSFVVKSRAPLPRAWRWEIYRAGRASPVECSKIYFETMALAHRAGKAALERLLIHSANPFYAS